MVSHKDGSYKNNKTETHQQERVVSHRATTKKRGGPAGYVAAATAHRGLLISVCVAAAVLVTLGTTIRQSFKFSQPVDSIQIKMEREQDAPKTITKYKELELSEQLKTTPTPTPTKTTANNTNSNNKTNVQDAPKTINKYKELSEQLKTTPTPTKKANTNNSNNKTNVHRVFQDFKCGDIITADQVPRVVYPLFEMVYGYNEEKKVNSVGHRNYKGPMEKGVQILAMLQVCSYATLDKFWDLANEYNITRWSAHGGTLMGATCHRSINPWDDDIDITVSSCHQLDAIFAQASNVTGRLPDVAVNQLTAPKYKWEGRLIDDDWILMKGDAGGQGNWFKLKSVAQARAIPNRDLSGMDIQCLDHRVSAHERNPMKRSGFRDALVNEEAQLQMVEYGPTQIMLVPDHVASAYVLERYKKTSFCDFPLDMTTPHLPAKIYESIGRATPPILPHRASYIEEALSKWYISERQRNQWLSEIGGGGKTKGNELTSTQVPNLDHIEIDNSIVGPSPQSCCQIGSKPGRELNVISFNAGRGTYWAEFAEMIESMPELQKPDIIILNAMDIGMARSGNVHTTRKLAFRLGMNYAWGLEFVELTTGNWEEQNTTKGMQNALGLHGNAILSTCPMYDPMIVRDKLDERYFSNNTKFSGNATGAEKRLGGRMGLFVRTGNRPERSFNENDPSSAPPHVIVGSVHKLEASGGAHREKMWEYLGFGAFPNGTRDEKRIQEGVPQNNNTLGIVMSGDAATRDFCTESGLRNLDDRPQTQKQHKTFPADCEKQQVGLWRDDQFCGNMQMLKDDQTILPCYESPVSQAANTSGVQISDHSIIQITLMTAASD